MVFVLLAAWAPADRTCTASSFVAGLNTSRDEHAEVHHPHSHLKPTTVCSMNGMNLWADPWPLTSATTS
jgi:hypothetical protein